MLGACSSHGSSLLTAQTIEQASNLMSPLPFGRTSCNSLETARKQPPPLAADGSRAYEPEAMEWLR